MDILKAYQRGIISGLIVETYDPEDINQRVKILNKGFKNYTQFFTKEQLAILRFVYRDYLKFNKDGCYIFGISEISEKILFEKFPHLIDEYIEITATCPLATCLIPEYLKLLENKFIEMKLGVMV